MTNRVFLDTAFAVAASITADEFHAKAVEVAAQIKQNSTPLITTRAVLLEIGNALSRQRNRAVAINLLQTLEVDPLVEIVPMSEELYARAFHLYRTRPDTEWGLVDCLSFVVMQERGITDALTTDKHFKQAGFRVLMREP